MVIKIWHQNINLVLGFAYKAVLRLDGALTTITHKNLTYY